MGAANAKNAIRYFCCACARASSSNTLFTSELFFSRGCRRANVSILGLNAGSIRSLMDSIFLSSIFLIVPIALGALHLAVNSWMLMLLPLLTEFTISASASLSNSAMVKLSP